MNGIETLGYFEDRLDRMVTAIREIVDIESPSRDAERSGAVADWIERQASDIKAELTFERIRVDDGTHLVIRAYPDRDRPTLFLGHTDTVHPVGSSVRNPTRVEDGQLYGCGIFDMKANIILMLEALRYFAESGKRPSTPVTILLSCDEEVGSQTGRPIVEREASASVRCLVFEPSSNGKIKTGRKGTGMFTLRTRGVPSHAGLEPEKGANAVLELARQIPLIHEIADASVGTTVNVCTINGGTTSNVIPENAECEIDVRFSSKSEASRVSSALGSLKTFDSRVSLELLGGINRPPLERTADVTAFYEKARTLAASFGYEIGETQVGGASDGNFVAALGIPILDGLGITGAGAHMLTEHIQVSDIAKRATLVTLLLDEPV